MDWRLFASVFALIFVAELPGKTTFASLLLSTRYHHWPVFLGACAAFALHTFVAVAAGSFIGLLPARIVHAAAGLLFIALAAVLWTQKPEDEADRIRVRADHRTAAATAFAAIFFAQWGDPTQLATAALAARYPGSWTIFASATLALWTVNGLAIAAGRFIGGKIRAAALQKIAAAVFGAAGLALLLSRI